MELPETCKKLISFHIQGNVVPIEWFDMIKMPSGKPDTKAILILSDIVYWYRPTVIRDETTGQIVDYRKKFKADKLQKSYSNYAKLFGFSKVEVKRAIDRLCELGVITREFRPLDTEAGHLSNVMYLDVVVEKLKPQYNPPSLQKSKDPLTKKLPPPDKKVKTYTENTTYNTTGKEYDLFDNKSYSSSQQSEAEKILNEWNNRAGKIKGISKHKSVYSKCATNKKDRKNPPVLIEIIQNCLENHTISDIKQSIANYFNVLQSKDYFYDYKFPTLGTFLSSANGLGKFKYKTGFSKFRKNTDPFSEVRYNIKFLSKEEFDPKKPLSKFNSMYMGMPIELVESYNVPLVYKEEILPRVKKDNLDYGRFVWLEECIIVLLYKKENVNLLKKLVEIHEIYLDKFKKGG